MKAIKTNAIITSLRSKVDGSLGLTISTPELSVQEKAHFMELQGINLNALFEPLDEPAELIGIKSEVNTKTPGQRLRSILFIWWKQLGEKEDFETFYRLKMEKLIDYPLEDIINKETQMIDHSEDLKWKRSSFI